MQKQKNGQIELTLTIPAETITKTRAGVVAELAREVEIPGFRKGKAPVAKAAAAIAEEKIAQKILQKLLPRYFTEAVNEHKVRPAIMPRFEIVSVEKDKDWQVKAITCEVPEVKLGAYKKAIKAISSKKELAKAEKEQKVLEALLAAIKIDLPEFLIEEEVNLRLLQLVERLDKLGLSLEKYLASVSKDAKSLRAEYAQEATRSIKVELILNAIAEQEKIKVAPQEVEQALHAASLPETPEQKRNVEAVLRKRNALDSVIGLL
jgi:FKBP-type peptidyl-prolyl cis-trans isomerase (trigger factor)